MSTRYYVESSPYNRVRRIDEGTARRLARLDIYTMEGIANAKEDMLYKVFGVDTELQIDHDNGLESATMCFVFMGFLQNFCSWLESYWKFF